MHEWRAFAVTGGLLAAFKPLVQFLSLMACTGTISTRWNASADQREAHDRTPMRPLG